MFQSITWKINSFKNDQFNNALLNMFESTLSSKEIQQQADFIGGEWVLPFRLGKGVTLSLAALLGSARLDRLKLVPWFL